MSGAMDPHAQLQREIEEQLAGQTEALAGVIEALQEAGSSEELEQAKAELEEAIADLTAALLQIRKAELLAKLDNEESGRTSVGECAPDASEAPPVQDDAPPNSHTTIGEMTRFRYMDGQWYCGRVQSIVSGEAVLSFAAPTRDFMCEPTRVALSSLRPLREALAPLSSRSAGTRVLVCLRDGGLWEEAELDAADEEVCGVVLSTSGRRLSLPIEWVLVPDDALPSDSDDDDMAGSSGEDDVEGAQEYCTASEAGYSGGAQTETLHFAGWEMHTRGIGSKLMASMGYVAGSGLGSGGKGRAAPVDVRLLRNRAGLGADDGFVVGVSGGMKKNKSRGGKKARQKKFATKARAAREEARDHAQRDAYSDAPGIFAFVNNSLGDKSKAAAILRAQVGDAPTRGAASSRFDDGQKAGGPPSQPKVDRKALVAQQDAVLAARQRVARLKEMGQRNRANKAISSQVMRQLKEAEQLLKEAEAEQYSTQRAISDKEKQKKWMKF